MKQTNCPNCGAPIHDEVCKYCGTRQFGINKSFGVSIQEACDSMVKFAVTCSGMTPNEARRAMCLDEIHPESKIIAIDKNIEYIRTELKTFEDRKKCQELYYEALKAMRNYR